MEVETHVHLHILNQLGFHELQLHAITRVENLWMEVGFYDLFTSYAMELKWYGMLYVSMVWYGMVLVS